MNYYIRSGKKYLDNHHNLVEKEKAHMWTSKEKAENFANHPPKGMAGYSFELVPVINISNEEFESKLDELSSLLASFYNLTTIEERKQSLLDQLSELDKKVVDIEHAIEFNKVGVVDGYKYYKLMHETLVERRRCKDCIQKLQIVSSAIDARKVATLLAQVESMSSKVYTPRVLSELFEEHKKTGVEEPSVESKSCKEPVVHAFPD